MYLFDKKKPLMISFSDNAHAFAGFLRGFFFIYCWFKSGESCKECLGGPNIRGQVRVDTTRGAGCRLEKVTFHTERSQTMLEIQLICCKATVHSRERPRPSQRALALGYPTAVPTFGKVEFCCHICRHHVKLVAVLTGSRHQRPDTADINTRAHFASGPMRKLPALSITCDRGLILAISSLRKLGTKNSIFFSQTNVFVSREPKKQKRKEGKKK